MNNLLQSITPQPQPRHLSELVEMAVQPDVEISGICDHSASVQAGDLFLCLPRAAERLDDFTAQAKVQGAAAVVTTEAAPASEHVDLRLRDMTAMGAMLRRWYETEASEVRCIGITGTDGKTSIAWMLREALSRKFGKTWALGTLGLIRDAEQIDDVGNTTPSMLTLHKLLAAATAQQVKALVMEVSSHGIEQQRIAGLDFNLAVWTNLGHDHLQDHGGYDAYAQLKQRFMRNVAASGNIAVCNGDSAEVVRLMHDAGDHVRWYAHGLYKNSDLDADMRWEQELPGMLRLAWQGREVVIEEIPAGDFHAENVAAVALSLCAGFDIELDELPELLGGISAPPGRMQPLDIGRWQVFIDYAHTPEALERCLQTARRLTRGRLMVVFGCGGERDREKRPEMGEIAVHEADAVWITSDNPRGELPEVIASEIESGMPQPYPAEVHLELDREQAICKAIAAMQPSDTLVIAGKGHESYMEIAGRRTPWSDFDVAAREVHAKEQMEERKSCA